VDSNYLELSFRGKPELTKELEVVIYQLQEKSGLKQVLDFFTSKEG